MKDLSIIIPIYNVERYLKDCLDSVVNQKVDFSLIEVLLINDGSIDSSANICEEYVSKFPFIKYVYKDNSGVSDSRNKGILLSNARYVTFLDSDDILAENYLQTIIDEIKKNRFDLCIFEYMDMPQKQNQFVGRVSHRDRLEINALCNGKKVLNRMAKRNIYLSNVWSIVYQKSLLIQHNIVFDSNYSASEDYDFIMNCLISAKYVKYCSAISVIYRRYREGSATNTYKVNHLISDIKVRIKWFEIFSDYGNLQLLMYIANDYAYFLTKIGKLSKEDIMLIKSSNCICLNIIKYSGSKKALLTRFLIHILGYYLTMKIIRERK
jgi:glycosyltransferase involved in cell wall biosynthesis